MKDGCLKPTVKHIGGSLIVWGYLTANGVGDLVRIDGIMNVEKYRQILIHYAIPSGKHLIANGFLFQQDNGPKQTAQKVKKLLKAKGIIWGCSSYEMAASKSRFEYHWVFVRLFRPKKGWKATSIKRISVASPQDAWNNIPKDYIQKLQLSIPKRINVILAAEGGPTEY